MGNDTIKESLLKKSPGLITLKKTEKILEQMKNCIGSITIDKLNGTGFFCNIRYKDNNKKDKILPVLMTNYHVLNEKNTKEKDINIIIRHNSIKKVVKKIKKITEKLILVKNMIRQLLK